MRDSLAPEHIPADTAAYWTDMVRQGGGALDLHRSFYAHGPARLRVRIMLTLCEVSDRTSVIEPGCGAGAISRGLFQMFHEVEGFDSCPEMISGAGPLARTKLWVEDADAWRPTRRYSVAFLSEILEHVRDPQRLVDVCAGACDFIVASAPIGDPLAGARAFDITARENCETRADGAGHIWTWDMDGFCEMFPAESIWFIGNVAEHAIVLARTGAADV